MFIGGVGGEMKYCQYCQKTITENNKNTKWRMFITKRGQKIVAFECMHFKCWKEFFQESVSIEITERSLNK